MKKQLNDSFLYLRNANGLSASFTAYGARWVGMLVPDRNGEMGDVLLGFDTLEEYAVAHEQYHGATVGRVCGRINNARFSIGDKVYHLASNDAYGKPQPNHLHGGTMGFHKKMWNWMTFVNELNEEGVTFTYFSPDGEEGYPGNMNVSVSYLLRNSNTLEMTYKVTVDMPTYVNLTNHSFFNLTADPRNSVLDHFLAVNAIALIECDEELIPTGVLRSVNDTLRFDGKMTIRESILASSLLRWNEPDISVAYALKNRLLDGVSAKLYDKRSGRVLTICTDLPSLQVYDAFFMDGSDIGKKEVPLQKYAGIALEPQGFPDAPNHPHFPSILVTAEQPFYSQTNYLFGLK